VSGQDELKITSKEIKLDVNSFFLEKKAQKKSQNWAIFFEIRMFFYPFYNIFGIKKAQKKQLVTRLFEQI
jgi:hypothetical protein